MTPDDITPPEHEPDPGPTSPRVAPELPRAREQRSRWPGWIWAVPIAAVAIVLWLVFKQIAANGPEVTVIFPQAGGISASNTTVEFQGVKVGEVETVKFENGLRNVKVTIRMSHEMEGHLGPGTKFWIAGPSLNDLGSIKAIISGPSIGIAPTPGKKQKQYAGLMEPPVVEEAIPGRHYVLHAAQLGSVSRGSAIYFHDLNVGSVEERKLQPDQTFDISIFVKAPYDNLVHDGTRFWNAGAAQVSMQGSGPRLQLQSISSLIQGAIDFETPSGAQAGPQAPDGHAFKLYETKDEARFAPGTNAVLYRIVFGADAGGLSDGAPVKLAGEQIGSVQHSVLQYDPHSGQLEQQVTIAIEPSRIALAGSASWPADPTTEMNTIMERLIAQGLRAQLGSSIPMVGPQNVDLAFVHDAPAATLIAGKPPEIPTTPGGSGLQGIMTAVNTVANKIDGVPIDQIADNIRTATGRLAQLSKSPQLTQSLDDLNRSLANVKQLTASADTQLPTLISELRRVAREAQGAVGQARQLISSTAGGGPLGVNSAGLTQTLYEVNRAAESIRELADYLTRHPSALIRGRE